MRVSEEREKMQRLGFNILFESNRLFHYSLLAPPHRILDTIILSPFFNTFTFMKRSNFVLPSSYISLVQMINVASHLIASNRSFSTPHRIPTSVQFILDSKICFTSHIIWKYYCYRKILSHTIHRLWLQIINWMKLNRHQISNRSKSIIIIMYPMEFTTQKDLPDVHTIEMKMF